MKKQFIKKLENQMDPIVMYFTKAEVVFDMVIDAYDIQERETDLWVIESGHFNAEINMKKGSISYNEEEDSYIFELDDLSIEFVFA